MIDRNKALALLNEYTKSASLIKHALAVESAMHWYAENYFKLVTCTNQILTLVEKINCDN